MKKFVCEATAGLFSTEDGAQDFVDWLQNESGYTTEQKKTVLQKVAELFQRIVDRIKELIGDGNLSEIAADFAEAQADEAARLRQMFLDVLDGMNVEEGATEEQREEKYSILSRVVADDGTEYNNVVLHDTNIFNGLNPENWGKPLMNYVYKNLAGRAITVYDNNNNQIIIEFAREKERTKKAGSKSSHKVLEELAYPGIKDKNKKRASEQRKNRRLASAHAMEIVLVSNPESESSSNKHGWLDKNGWEYRSARLVGLDGTIYSAVLNIAKTRDGRNILYAINQISPVGHVSGSLVIKQATKGQNQTSDTIISLPQNGEEVNTLEEKNSLPMAEQMDKLRLSLGLEAQNRNLLQQNEQLRDLNRRQATQIREMQRTLTKSGVETFADSRKVERVMNICANRSS